jgi:hypothetical protein
MNRPSLLWAVSTARCLFHVKRTLADWGCVSRPAHLTAGGRTLGGTRLQPLQFGTATAPAAAETMGPPIHALRRDPGAAASDMRTPQLTATTAVGRIQHTLNAKVTAAGKGSTSLA